MLIAKLGGGLRNKAFTLIELLAIIVILAIIAVITVPIILNIIENSRKGAAIDSAYGYKDAVSKYYVSNMIDNQDISLNGFYLIKDGILKRGNEDPVEIAFSGTAPSEGNLVINKGSVEAGCMILDDYKITILNGKVSATEKGKCYGIPVYYDVKEGKECDSTSTSDNCMKWYIYDADESTYTMILDHNLELEGVAWNSIGRDGKYTNSEGPSTAANQVLGELKKATDGWGGVDKRTDSYTVEWTYNSTTQSYPLDYNGYRARLISAVEINKITGLGDGTVNGISENRFYSKCDQTGPSTFGCTKGENPYGWLFDNMGDKGGGPYTYDSTNFGSNYGQNTGLTGYWTSSPDASINYNAWVVTYSGTLYTNNVTATTKYGGIRPVITISKSLILSE